jgi:hypothetical protein
VVGTKGAMRPLSGLKLDSPALRILNVVGIGDKVCTTPGCAAFIWSFYWMRLKQITIMILFAILQDLFKNNYKISV